MDKEFKSLFLCNVCYSQVYLLTRKIKQITKYYICMTIMIFDIGVFLNKNNSFCVGNCLKVHSINSSKVANKIC